MDLLENSTIFWKNKTNIGLGSKAVEKEIDKFEKGEISEENIKDTITKYKTILNKIQYKHLQTQQLQLLLLAVLT